MFHVLWFISVFVCVYVCVCVRACVCVCFYVYGIYAWNKLMLRYAMNIFSRYFLSHLAAVWQRLYVPSILAYRPTNEPSSYTKN